MTDARLTLSGLACLRGGRMLLAGIDLTLVAGQCAVLRGPNGTGKSSLIRAVAGLLPVYAGKVVHDGAMALSDENLAFDLEAPLARALRFWAGIDHVGDDAVDVALTAFGLSRLHDVPVRMLSTGQRKRAVLARVAASGASIWLLDEPANGLDSGSIAMLGTVMARHLGEGGIILAASHQPLPLAHPQELDLTRFQPEADAV